VFSSHIVCVFKLLTVSKKHLLHFCVAYSSICKPVFSFLENMWNLSLFGCGTLCQCNVLGHVRQLKDVLVYTLSYGWDDAIYKYVLHRYGVCRKLLE